MLKLVAVGVVGAAVARSGVACPGRPAAAAEPVRFSVEGDMGAVRATANGQTFQVSGSFAERAAFVLG